MKIFNSQAEVDAALNSDGNLVVADDVQFKTDVRLDGNIDARNINARNIDAWNIDYYAACLAYDSFRCRSVKGCRDNALHACLDQEIEFIKEAK